MQVIIQSPHLKIRRELHQLIYKNVEHLQKLNASITRCDVFLKKENDDTRKFCVEIRLKVSKSTLFAGEQGENPGVALHKGVKSIESQLRRLKTEREKARVLKQ